MIGIKNRYTRETILNIDALSLDGANLCGADLCGAVWKPILKSIVEARFPKEKTYYDVMKVSASDPIKLKIDGEV